MVKSLVIRILSALGLIGLFRHLNRGSLTILLYHGVAPKAGLGMYNYRGKFITPEAFSEQASFLSKHYKVLDLENALEKLKNETLPPYSAIITFDDGYKNFYDYAFPILKQHNLTATFFIPTDFVLNKIPLWTDRLEYLGLKNDSEIRQRLKLLSDEEKIKALEKLEMEHGSVLRDFNENREVYAPLSVEMIKEMQNAGMKFGAHTQSHPILSKIEPVKLSTEISGSKKLLEENIGQVSKIFCYPNGQLNDFNEIVLEEIKNTGFIGALTTLEGVNNKNTNPYFIKRITMDNISDTRKFLFVLSGLRGFLRKII